LHSQRKNKPKIQINTRPNVHAHGFYTEDYFKQKAASLNVHVLDLYNSAGDDRQGGVLAYTVDFTIPTLHYCCKIIQYQPITVNYINGVNQTSVERKYMNVSQIDKETMEMKTIKF